MNLRKLYELWKSGNFKDKDIKASFQRAITQEAVIELLEEKESKSLPIVAFSLLYQKEVPGQTTNKVVAVILSKGENDDDFSLKADAERYVSGHEKLSKETKDMNIVAWTYSIEDKG